MKSIREILALSCDYLTDRQVPDARKCVEELLSAILGVDRLELYMNIDRPLEEDEIQRCRQGVRRLAFREPWQYVVGKVDFYGCRLEINGDVLIPRQETEILAEIVAKKLAALDLEKRVLWDVCCGSGCLGIALKKRFPALSVSLSDLSSRALSLAEFNAVKNDVEVELLEGDLFIPFAGKKADFIVCNPPYVSEEEYRDLDPEVVNYEPRQALVAGPTGLELYRSIAEKLKGAVNPGARVWLEIGRQQGESVARIFRNAGWDRCRFEKDWSGHDRFFFLEN